MNISQFHFNELWALGFYYFYSLLYCLGVTGVVGVLLLLARRNNSGQMRLTIFSRLLFVPLLMWVFYFTASARDAIAITSLDSEDDVFAELVYKSIFDVNLNKAVKLAIDERQAGNVRFYASCRIADILVTNNNYTKAVVLTKVTDAPEFRTGFFKTNQLSCGFFVPNYAEGPFSVNEIIEKRLQILQSNTPALTHGLPSKLQ